MHVHACIRIRLDETRGAWATFVALRLVQSPADRGALPSHSLPTFMGNLLLEGRSNARGTADPALSVRAAGSLGAGPVQAKDGSWGRGHPSPRQLLGVPPRESTFPGAMDIPLRSRSHIVTVAPELLQGASWFPEDKLCRANAGRPRPGKTGVVLPPLRAKAAGLWGPHSPPGVRQVTTAPSAAAGCGCRRSGRDPQPGQEGHGQNPQDRTQPTWVRATGDTGTHTGTRTHAHLCTHMQHAHTRSAHTHTHGTHAHARVFIKNML